MLSPNFKCLIAFILVTSGVSAQNLDALFESGLQDAQQFAQVILILPCSWVFTAFQGLVQFRKIEKDLGL